MRTKLLISLCPLWLGSLSLAACSSNPPPDETTGTSAGAGTSTGANDTGASSSGSGTGGEASTGASSSGSTGGSVSGGSSTGAPIEAGTLWIGGANAFSPEVLAKSATNPAFTYTCPPVDTLKYPAQGGSEVIDSQGQLWTQFLSAAPANVLSMWSPGQLAQDCKSRHADVNLNVGQGSLANLAFDASGNLWASSPSGNEVVAYGANNLLSSNSISPSYVLAKNPKNATSSLFNPTGLAFDTTGTLWVANYYSILAYHTATLAQAITGVGGNSLVPPDLVLTNPQAANVESDGGLYNNYVYQYLAFDGSGNLWVTVQNYLNGPVTSQIIEFSAPQLGKLATNGQPAPIFTINQPSDQGASFSGWSAIAFDSTGNLWAGAHLAAPNLYRYPAGSLTGNGTPDIEITALGDTDMNRSFTLAFDPSTLPRP